MRATTGASALLILCDSLVTSPPSCILLLERIELYGGRATFEVGEELKGEGSCYPQSASYQICAYLVVSIEYHIEHLLDSYHMS